MSNNNQNMDLQQFGRVTTQTDTTYSNAPAQVPESGGIFEGLKMSYSGGGNEGYFANASSSSGSAGDQVGFILMQIGVYGFAGFTFLFILFFAMSGFRLRQEGADGGSWAQKCLWAMFWCVLIAILGGALGDMF